MLKQGRLLDRIGAEIRMVNGEKKEAMQEQAVMEKVYSSENIQRKCTIGDKFYGGADMRVNSISVIPNRQLPIDFEK